MPPGKEGKIELAVEHTDGLGGEIAKSASVSTNDPTLPMFNLVLRARFKTAQPSGAPPVGVAGGPSTAARNLGPFVVEPNDRWTTNVIVGTTVSDIRYMYNEQAAPFHLIRVEPGGDALKAVLEALDAPNPKRYQLTLTSNSTLKPGHYTQTVKVITDSPKQAQINVDVDMTVVAKVFWSPQTIVVPTSSLAAESSVLNLPVIYIRKIREGGLKIKRFSASSPFIQLDLHTEMESPNGQVYSLRIHLDKSKAQPGLFKDIIHIETNDEYVPVIDIPIQCSFT